MKIACTLMFVAIAVWSIATYGMTLLAICWMVFGAGLLALAWIDARTKLLPDYLTLTLMWLGIAMQLFPETRTVGLESSIWGVLAGYIPLWLFAHLYFLIRRREGLGFGDLKLLAAMGAWSGPMVIPGVIFLASLLAIAGVILGRVLAGRSTGMTEEFPFGPWIIGAYMLSVGLGFMIRLY